MLLCFDVVALLVVLWLSFSLRFNQWFIPNHGQLLVILAAPAIAIPIFVRMGLYRSVLRYLPERAVETIFVAVTVAALAWVSFAFLTQMTGFDGVPRSVALSYWALSVVVIALSRFGAKRLIWKRPPPLPATPRSLVYGTGGSAMQLARALTASVDRNIVGFVSEDESLAGMEMLGLRVYSVSGLAAVVENFGITEIIVTTSLPNGAARRDLMERFSSLPVRVRILPSIADITSGKYSATDIRDIDLDDLLRRSPVSPDFAMMREVIEGRVILVTGAAGSIGSALCRTVAKLNPAKLILMDFNEHGLYEIAREISAGADFPIMRTLGSVTDASTVRHVLSRNKVDTVYHCAAFKHVSMVEANCVEGARNNVLGTWTVVEAAHELGVKNFILISSDKAVRPTSVMGATKRWAELIVEHYADCDSRGGANGNFAVVRFGNVIGSSGSVVPLFREQIAAAGPVTLTHEDMTRYFMSVREAAELIIQATALSESGDVLMLDMGEPVKIRTLAEDMIMLAGYTIRSERNPDGDIEIVTIGAAEGEKLHEELFYDPSSVQPTDHSKIMRGGRRSERHIDVAAGIAKLKEQIETRDEAAIRETLFDVT